MGILTGRLNGQHSQISVCTMEEYSKSTSTESREAHKYTENLIVFESTLSTQLSPERTRGVTSVIRALRSGSTFREMQNAFVCLQNQVHPITFDSKFNIH